MTDRALIKFGDLARMPAGTTVIYENDDAEHRRKYINTINSYARRSGGKFDCQFINGFDSHNNPVYLTRVTVLDQGEKRKRPGRKPE